MSRRPYTSEQMAEARLAVTSFDALVRDHGPEEAEALRNHAFQMLQADRAARIDARWMARTIPGEAA